MLAALLAAGCPRGGRVNRVECRVMDTVAAVQFRGGTDGTADSRVAQAAFDVFNRVEREFSAFDPGSVIRRTGRCSEFGRPCWDFAFRLKEQTGGAFDPGWKGGGLLDFGAVAKGFAVDLAAEKSRGAACDALIDLGGNLKAVKGDWKVLVKDGGTFTLREGEACATSARYYRGEHIHDARRGGAVTNGVHSVTVVHPNSAMVADGLSTALFILGRAEGEAFVKRNYPEAKVIWIDARL